MSPWTAWCRAAAAAWARSSVAGARRHCQTICAARSAACDSPALGPPPPAGGAAGSATGAASAAISLIVFSGFRAAPKPGGRGRLTRRSPRSGTCTTRAALRPGRLLATLRTEVPLTNLEIADALDRLADLLQVERENPFKVRAFRRAARSVEGHPVAMETLVAGGGDPTTLPGVGREIANVIRELMGTGKSTRIETMAQSAPPSLLELTRLPGLGPKRARLVWDRLGIATLPELETAAAAGRLAELPGFGEKTQTRILTALAEKREMGRRLLLPAAEVILVDLLRHLRAVPGVVRVEAAGSFRRRFETVGVLDVLCAPSEPRRALAAFTGWHRTARVEGAGETRATIVLRRGAQVDLRVVPPESFGAAWIYLTGSKAHNVALRARAVERGWKLSEWGLFAGRDGKSRKDQGERLAGVTEE